MVAELRINCRSGTGRGRKQADEDQSRASKQKIPATLAHSAPASIDEIFVAGNEPRIVGSEEQGEGGNVFGYQPPGEALRFDDLSFAFRRVPFHLAGGAHVAGNDAVHADIVAA